MLIKHLTFLYNIALGIAWEIAYALVIISGGFLVILIVQHLK